MAHSYRSLNRQARLSNEAESMQCQRQQESHVPHVPGNTQQHYLYEEGWTNSSLEHHQQPWAMDKFHTQQSKWQQRLCTACHEIWP